MGEDKNIIVNIDVTGDVINSPITGISISSSDGWSRRFDRYNLFTTIFTEFLGLPSIQELEWQFKVKSARRKGRVSEYNRVAELWKNALWSGAVSDSSVVKLFNVQITEFVSRSPGYPYTGDMGARWEGVWEDSVLTPSFTYSILSQRRDLAFVRLGLGDVRFTSTERDFYLLNVISSGSTEWASKLDASSRRNSTDQSPLALGRRLYDFTQELYLSSGYVDGLTLGGFPVLITKNVYDCIADHLHKYGAVALQSIEGMIVPVPQDFPLAYGIGLPKWCLLVGSPKHIKGIHQPEPIVCSAWTATVGDSPQQEAGDKYLQWMFKVGVEDWHSQLQQAVEVIDTVRSKIGATAIFEFDEERNWFDPYTPFTPRTMRELFQKIKQKQYKGLQLLVGQPHGSGQPGGKD